MAKAPPADKRRQILDAAVHVFARQGFHATRVSDIADEAGVAYGLVYHYFKSKDEVMNELFLERWSLLRSAIVDPWGTVLALAPDEECFVAADLDLGAQARTREQLPSLANRRPSAYRWPTEVPA